MMMLVLVIMAAVEVRAATEGFYRKATIASSKWSQRRVITSPLMRSTEGAVAAICTYVYYIYHCSFSIACSFNAIPC